MTLQEVVVPTQVQDKFVEMFCSSEREQVPCEEQMTSFVANQHQAGAAPSWKSNRSHVFGNSV